MMKIANTKPNPIRLDTYGTRREGYNKLKKPENIYACKWVSVVAVVLFCYIDFLCISVLWNKVTQPEDIMFIYAVSIGCAAALDVPLAIAGYMLKYYHHRLKTRKEAIIILVLSIIVFGAAFVCSFLFRITTRNLSYALHSAGTMATLGSAVQAEESSGGTVPILVAAVFNGIVPLLTSISSFVISYYSFDPIEIRLSRLNQRKIDLDANIIEIHAGIAEADSAEEHAEMLLLREKDLYAEHVEAVKAQGEYLKQLARIEIMRRINNPEGISSVNERAMKYMADSKAEEMPMRSLYDAVSRKAEGKSDEQREEMLS